MAPAAFSEPLGLTIEIEERRGALAAVRMRRPRPGEPDEAHPTLARILRHLATGREDLRDVVVALDVAPFDRRVLEAMREVPAGSTITYGALADRLGAPAASRAVGGACARNPIPIVIPCHRVVGADGSLVHYSGEGGVATKRRLLAIERPGPRQSALPL